MRENQVQRFIPSLVRTVGVSAIILSLLVAQPAFSRSTGSDGRPSVAAMQDTIEAFLVERTSHLVTTGSQHRPASLPMAASFSSKVRAHGAVLDARRTKLKSLGTEYTHASTAVEIVDVKTSGDTITVTATERTKLFFRKIHGDEPEFSAYSLDQRFVFHRSGGDGWTLVEQAPLSDDALQPITEAIDQVDNPAIDPDSSSPVRPSGRLPDDPKSEPDQSGAGGITPMAIPTGLSYSAMVSYAVKYWDVYNTAYRSFPQDCTNFISQSLRNGGWTFVGGDSSGGGDRTNPNYWWYGWLTQTYTWGGAQNWSQFAPKRTVLLSNAWSMALADVLQLDFEKDGIKDHTMIVTKKTTTNIYLTYHTTDHLNRPMTEIQTLYSNSAWWYAWRT